MLSPPIELEGRAAEPLNPPFREILQGGTTMCFSATASFALGAVLLPIGGWSVQKAWKGDRHFLPLAMFPLSFSIQQLIEGGVWLGLDANNTNLMHTAAIGFVCFSHGFWLAWTPFTVSMVEERSHLQWLWRGLTLVGLGLGAYFLLPLIAHPDWLSVEVNHRSLDYSLQILISNPVLAYLGRMLYVATILLPLLLSQNAVMQKLGWLVLGSLVLTSYLFSYGFISVWCYFAAVTSVYVGYQLAQGIESKVESPQMGES